MISLIKGVLSIISLLMFLGGAGSAGLQKTSKWVKREAIVKVHNELRPLSDFTKKLTSIK